ncbi:MAG: hypothetical protein KGM47_05850, partial [Acidobacteriota bacterium]|nr:hypothetical protein [Acidobacteriota bacterium]
KTQADMAANADSTRGSLNSLGGSIARDHAELVELEKQGQRNYYEFDLFKSKRFAREGPISVDLRHTNTKHRNYDVELLVNDSKLTKKHVSLYEPIVLAAGAGSQPLELVVNQIDKNHIHGYVSVPKTYTERASVSAAPQASEFSLTPARAGQSQPVAAAASPAQASAELTSSNQP